MGDGTEVRYINATEVVTYWNWLANIFTKSVGGGIEIHYEELAYLESPSGKQVRIYWYPNTPIGFNEVFGRTVEEAIQRGMEEYPNG